MCIQVIHHQNDFIRIGVGFINKPLQLKRPITSRSARISMRFAPAAQRLCEHKYGTRALSDIFAVVFFTMVILTHRNWLQIFIQKLKRLFIHADHGAFLIEGTRIYLKDVLHMRYEFGVLFWRNTPHLLQVRLATVYKGNIIKNLIMDCQSYTKYRPNETTGGIFVSWRRKEELPTGA